MSDDFEHGESGELLDETTKKVIYEAVRDFTAWVNITYRWNIRSAMVTWLGNRGIDVPDSE